MSKARANNIQFFLDASKQNPPLHLLHHPLHDYSAFSFQSILHINNWFTILSIARVLSLIEFCCCWIVVVGQYRSSEWCYAAPDHAQVCSANSILVTETHKPGLRYASMLHYNVLACVWNATWDANCSVPPISHEDFILMWCSRHRVYRRMLSNVRQLNPLKVYVHCAENYCV